MKSQKFVHKVADSIGKNMFNKAISTVTEMIFSKTFVYKINTLIGTFNPILIGASFGLSHYMKQRDNKKKEEQVTYQLKCALESVKEKVDLLKGLYYKSLNLIDRILGRKV